MAGMEGQFAQSPEFVAPSERQPPEARADALLHEYPSLPATPNTAAPHLPDVTFYDPAQWTVAVDLTSDLMLKDGTHAQRHQEEGLLQLVEQSKGDPDVAIVVQVAENVPTETPDSPLPETDLNRYVIRDGQITNQQTADSKGMAANVTGLLEYANDVAPSEHLGLVIQSHGDGAQGLSGGTGRASMEELKQAIDAGLGDERDKLDILALDSCSMATPAVLAAVSPVTDYMVASELRGGASPNFAMGGAMNLNAVLTDLMENPEVSAEEFGEIMVEESNRGNQPEVLEPGAPERVGMDVLANYDTAEFEQFNRALNELGNQLLTAAQDEQSKGEIEKLIDQTSMLPSGSKLPYRRDLCEFVLSVQEAAQDGRLPDEDGTIFEATKDVLAAQDSMTRDLFLSDSGAYDDLGGTYVFLPTAEVREGAVDLPAGLNRLVHLSEKEFNPRRQEKSAAQLEQVTNNIYEHLSAPARTEFQPVVDAADGVKNAQSYEDFLAATRQLNSAAKALLNTDVEDELREILVQQQDIPGSDRWNEFINSFVSE